MLKLREAVVGAFQLQHVVRELPRERPVPAPVGGATDEQRGSSAPPQHRHDVVVPEEWRQPHTGPATVGGRARGQRRERFADHEELSFASPAYATAASRRAFTHCGAVLLAVEELIPDEDRAPAAAEVRLRSRRRLTGIPASIAPGRTIAVRWGSPAYS